MNTKMIRYILAKMLGVEAILLLLPALVQRGILSNTFRHTDSDLSAGRNEEA